jgi:hypothetical protein
MFQRANQATSNNIMHILNKPYHPISRLYLWFSICSFCSQAFSYSMKLLETFFSTNPFKISITLIFVWVKSLSNQSSAINGVFRKQNKIQRGQTGSLLMLMKTSSFCHSQIERYWEQTAKFANRWKTLPHGGANSATNLSALSKLRPSFWGVGIRRPLPSATGKL